MNTSCFDVACYILTQRGSMSAMKLQKLVYYSQAWSLVWDEKPLFSERIEAWANGPVVRDLYFQHQGKFEVELSMFCNNGKSDNLDDNAIETIDAVLDHYGEKSAHWLSVQTHNEAPWKEARGNLEDGERCENEISHASMAEYYSAFA